MVQTWKSDLALQLAFNQTANIVATMAAVHQQKITDTRLLEYMYNTTVEALRRSEKNGITTASTGVATLSCWQSTAKSMQRKNDRMALWDTLFAAAMREDCWEDARFVSYLFYGQWLFLELIVRRQSSIITKKVAHRTRSTRITRSYWPPNLQRSRSSHATDRKIAWLSYKAILQ
jgi:hypothetical protein